MEEEDKDYALAIQLQEQFDEEYTRKHQEEEDWRLAVKLQGMEEQEERKYRKKSHFEKIEVVDELNDGWVDPLIYGGDAISYLTTSEAGPVSVEKKNGTWQQSDFNLTKIKQTRKEKTGNGKDDVRKSSPVKKNREKILDEKTQANLTRMKKSSESTFLNLERTLVQGKHSVLFLARQKDKTFCAIKIYLIHAFSKKNVDQFLSGEFRYRHGYDKSKVSKVVSLWCQKEFHNLSKAWKAKINCPKPLEFKKNILMMELIGNPEVGARRLNECSFSDEELRSIYIKVLSTLRLIYQEAKLVHADFSEYNLLYYNDDVFVVDWGQAIEVQNPNALHFLKGDCQNISNYFIKLGFNRILNLRELFEFVTDRTIPKKKIIQYLTTKLDENREPLEVNGSNEDKIFAKVFTPQTLHDVKDFDTHQEKASQEDFFSGYRTVVGLNKDLNGPAEWVEEDQGEGEDSTSTESNDQEDDQQLSNKPNPNKVDLGKLLQSMEKKERKEYIQKLKKAKTEKKRK